MPLAGDHVQGLTRAPYLVVHDFSRDASHVLAELMTLAAGDNATTLIIAPQFLLDSDIARFADHLPDGGKNFARWTLGGWNSGGDSLPLAQEKGISSFTVMDLLLMYLADKTNFPDLNQITIVGHGEGADFVQRYAAAGQATDILNQQNRWVLAFRGRQPVIVFISISPPNGRKPASQLLTLATTKDAAPTCADFNNWPYGLDAPNAYVKHIGRECCQTRLCHATGDLSGQRLCRYARRSCTRPSCAAQICRVPAIAGTCYNYQAYLGFRLLVTPHGQNAGFHHHSECRLCRCRRLFGSSLWHVGSVRRREVVR